MSSGPFGQHSFLLRPSDFAPTPITSPPPSTPTRGRSESFNSEAGPSHLRGRRGGSLTATHAYVEEMSSEKKKTKEKEREQFVRVENPRRGDCEKIDKGSYLHAEKESHVGVLKIPAATKKQT
jgi:hypothetical protein